MMQLTPCSVAGNRTEEKMERRDEMRCGVAKEHLRTFPKVQAVSTLEEPNSLPVLSRS